MCACERSLDSRQLSHILFRLLVCIGLPIIFVYNIEIESEEVGLQKDAFTISKMLPPPKQTWVHAVDNRRMLLEALQDETITAIETDLLMGNAYSNTRKVPIMAHPPSTSSDLPMNEFWQLVASNDTMASKAVRKVIKLDFKEPETVEPTLKALAELNIQTSGDNAIFLNADILPGPGKRLPGAVTIEAKAFLETCLHYIQQSPARIAFSLGYKADYSDSDGYTKQDVEAMAQLIQDYKLVEQKIGVVLALNARQLAKSLEHWDSILTKYPPIQILAWTGKGEPPIPQTLLRSIQDHFETKDLADRIGYDCQVSGDE